MAAIAREQQGPAELLVVDKRATGSAQHRVELVPRGIFRIRVEQIACNQPGLADAIEELVAPLRSVVRAAGERDKATGCGEQRGDEYAGGHAVGLHGARRPLPSQR